MTNAKNLFADRLRDAMKAAGYDAKPAVLEREFNTRYWGKPMTLHGVRRWLRGETLPTHEKILVLAEWLAVSPPQLGFGDEIHRKVEQRRARWDSGIGYEDRDIFEAYLKLPVPQRKLLAGLSIRTNMGLRPRHGRWATRPSINDFRRERRRPWCQRVLVAWW